MSRTTNDVIPELPDEPYSRLEQYLEYIALNGGGGGGGTSNYNQLSNKPKINGVTLSGDKTTEDLGIDVSDSDILDQLYECGILTPTTANNGNLFVSENNQIFIM